MKLTISFLTINYKKKTTSITVSEVQIEYKSRLFMLKLVGSFKMQDIAIKILKIYDNMRTFLYVRFYNDRNYKNMLFFRIKKATCFRILCH